MEFTCRSITTCSVSLSLLFVPSHFLQNKIIWLSTTSWAAKFWKADVSCINYPLFGAIRCHDMQCLFWSFKRQWINRKPFNWSIVLIKFRHTTRSSLPDFNFYNFSLDPLNFYIKCCLFAIRLTREVSHFPAFCVTSVKRNQRKERLLRVRLLLAPIFSSVSFTRAAD